MECPMDEASNRRGLPGYLQAAEQGLQPKRSIRALRTVNDVEPAIALSRLDPPRATHLQWRRCTG